MTTKEYLLQVHKSENIMRYYEQKAEALRVQASGIRAITYDKDRVQVSPSDVMSATVVKLVELEEKYGEAIAEHHALVLRVSDQVNALPNPDYVQVLTLRYLKPNPDGRLKPLEQIACEMHLSFYRIAHLHGEALEAFRRKWLVAKDSKH